jgi:hypothetical protein
MLIAYAAHVPAEIHCRGPQVWLPPRLLIPPGRRPKGCAPQLLPIHGSSSVPLCLRESNFFSQRHGDTEFMVNPCAVHVPAEPHCRGPQLWITPQLLILRGGKTNGVPTVAMRSCFVAIRRSSSVPLCLRESNFFSQRHGDTEFMVNPCAVHVPADTHCRGPALWITPQLLIPPGKKTERVCPPVAPNPRFFLRAFVPP